MKRTYTWLCALCLLLLAAPVGAKIQLSPLFSDHMVLQQQREVLLWGLSDQKQVTITASWGEVATASVDRKTGCWQATLKTPQGSFEKQSLSLSDGDQTLQLSDLLLGEVWICSGQSNMYMPLRGYTGQPVQGSFETVMASSEQADRIRMVTLPKRAAEEPQRSFEGKGWQVPSPESAWAMSATAYYFAQHLGAVLQVPIGIVSTSWGGSAIEAWMSPEDLRQMGYEVEQINADPKREERRKCALLYNGLIAPVEGFAARGFLWYQGESNRHTADCYAEQMERMVRFWRERWSHYLPNRGEEMPFYYVQIAPHAYKNAMGEDAPLLVEAQIEAEGRIPRAGIVSTTDLGESDCIHPAEKEVVGERLTALALRECYGVKIPNEAAHPVRFEEARCEGEKIILTLANARYGLTPQHRAIEGFEVAGEDGIFYPAQAQIITSKPQVEITCEAVSAPRAVRYAWRNYTPTNLHNTLGQPLLPFRTTF